MRRPELTIPQILGWTDAWHAAGGRWPRRDSGRIPGSLGETWTAIDIALKRGLRGLPGGSSLAQLLAEHRGVRNRMRLPRLQVGRILVWMHRHQRRTGMWPNHQSGPILDAPGEHWKAVDQALRRGLRGLRGGSSLARLLAQYRGVGMHRRRPPFTVPQLVAWADAHRSRNGWWPTKWSGAIPEAKGTSWMVVHVALRQGKRGLPGGSSLARLLWEQRGVRPLHYPPLFVEAIRGWAAAHQTRTGRWPTAASGPIAEAPRETWLAVDMALRKGLRGLPGGSSLHRLLHASVPAAPAITAAGR